MCRSVCGETVLLVRVGQLRLAVVACLVTQERDRVAAERSAAAGWEQRLVGLAGALVEPFAQHGDGLLGQRRGALFAALPEDLDVRAGAEVHVLAAQAGELGDAQPGLDREGQQRVVATADPAVAVRRGQERVDLLGGEVGDDRAVEAFGRDGEHAADQRGVLGVRNAAKRNIEWIAARRALRVRGLLPRSCSR